jgi:hypothetical protein
MVHAPGAWPAPCISPANLLSGLLACLRHRNFFSEDHQNPVSPAIPDSVRVRFTGERGFANGDETSSAAMLAGPSEREDLCVGGAQLVRIHSPNLGKGLQMEAQQSLSVSCNVPTYPVAGSFIKAACLEKLLDPAAPSPSCTCAAILLCACAMNKDAKV